ncbi:MAG: hypothetical protein ACRDD1_17730, partial [Planctomycetia bacterium]
PTFRIGLYGFLVGACGRKSDAPALRAIIESPVDRPLTGLDGLMGGYCLLEPTIGPTYVLDVLTDPKQPFNTRYAALRTVRFLLTDLPSVDRKQLFDRMAAGLQINDMSDLVMDELRKNKQWGSLDAILALYDKQGFELQVVRRAILRFALQCPEPKAKAFMEKAKAANPQLVADVEEILKFEDSLATPPSAPGN